jgi:hypothetical protein
MEELSVKARIINPDDKFYGCIGILHRNTEFEAYISIAGAGTYLFNEDEYEMV